MQIKEVTKGLVVQIFYVIMLFTAASNIVVEQWQNTLSIIVLWGIGILILSVVIFYLWLKGGIISGKVGVYWLVWDFCVLYTFWQKRMDVTSMIFMGIPAVAVLLYPRWGQTLTMKRYYCRWTRFFLGLVSVYYSFALIGNELFMQETRMNLSSIRVSLFVLYTVTLYPSIYAVVVLFEWLAKKARNLELENDKRKVILAGGVCGLATGIVLFGCAYGFYPAGMSNDSVRHWSEALGIWNISDRSPIAFTLFIRFLSDIYHNPFVYVIFQVVFFALVSGSFFSYLREKGISLVFLVPCAVITGILPNNYTEVAYLSKNPLFAIINLWLIVLLTKLFECPKKCLGVLFRKKLLVCLIALYLIRFNNIPAYVFAIAAMIYLTVRFYKAIQIYLVDIAVSSAILIAITVGPIYDLAVQEHHETSFPFSSTITASLGCALLNDIDLPEDTLEIMNNVLPLELWKERYSPHNADTFSFGDPRPNMIGINAQAYLKAYGRLFISAPDIVIKSLLDGNESLWNISMAKTSWNRRFYYGIPENMPQEILPEKIQTLEPQKGRYLYKTVTTSFAIKFAEWTASVKILDILIWRSGIYIVLLLCFLVFITVNRHFERIWVILPTCMTIGTYALLLGWQIYSYTYFIGIGIIVFIVMTLLSLFSNKKTIMVS